VSLTRLEHKHVVFLVCVVGLFITVFDTTSAIVALPTIAHEFATDLPTAQWVIIANGLTIAALLVPVGRVADIIGMKRIYVLGALLLAVGALFAAWSTTIYGLIGARAFVGVGSAMTQGTAMAILIGSFEADDRARMLGLQLGAVGLGQIVGPSLGGWVTGTVGWRALFAITAVGMLVIAIASQRTLPRRESSPRLEQPFDYGGAVAFSTFLVCLLLTLTLGPGIGWLAPATLVLAAASLSCLALFIGVERRHAAPMMSLTLFRNAEFALGALAALVVFMGVASTRFLVPFFLQAVRGIPAAQVGLMIVPAAVVTAIAAPFAGNVADRFGVRLFANVGMGLAMLGFGTFAVLGVATPSWVVIGGLMLMSLGLAVFSPANSASILSAVGGGSHGVVAGFISLCRNSGNVIGIAFGTVIVTVTMASAGYPPSLAAVDPAADRGLLRAFTAGVDLAALALSALAFVVLVVIVAWSSRARARRSRGAVSPVTENAGRRRDRTPDPSV
jgi:EmrB/QacA subfamily drug resistance transporter